MAHGFAVDPKTGDVYIGDREEYRIVVYTGDGKFLRTMQLRNLICALYFDKAGQSVGRVGLGRPVPEGQQADRPGAGRDRQRQWHRAMASSWRRPIW